MGATFKHTKDAHFAGLPAAAGYLYYEKVHRMQENTGKTESTKYTVASDLAEMNDDDAEERRRDHMRGASSMTLQRLLGQIPKPPTKAAKQQTAATPVCDGQVCDGQQAAATPVRDGQVCDGQLDQ